MGQLRLGRIVAGLICFILFGRAAAAIKQPDLQDEISNGISNGIDKNVEAENDVAGSEKVILQSDGDIQDLGLVFEDLNDRICDLNAQIQEARKALTSTVLSLNDVIHHDACDVEFDDRCFHLAVDEDMRFPAAKGYCRNLGWDLGTVYSEGHLRELESYFRHELPQHSDRIRLWIGGTSSEEILDGLLIPQSHDAMDSIQLEDAYTGNNVLAVRIFAANRGNSGIARYQESEALDGVLCEL